MNLSHLEPSDCPLPNLQIFLACVISGIDLIFHSFYRIVVLTSWDRSMSDYERESLIESLEWIAVRASVSALAWAMVWKRLSASRIEGPFLLQL